MKIALIPMSAKPFHSGHFDLIEFASKNADATFVFVSVSDRKRKNEMVISGTIMQEFWDECILQYVTQHCKNTQIIFVEKGSSPVKMIIDKLMIKNEEVNKSIEEFTIFVGTGDENLWNSVIEKYLQNLLKENRIKVSTLDRTNNIISGTSMREYLRIGNINNFINGLPNFVPKDIANKYFRKFRNYNK